MAVRLSIGASRRQLIRQLLTESMLLAVFGAVGRAARREVDARSDCIDHAARGRGAVRLHAEPADAGVRGRAGDEHGPAVRPVPGAAQHPSRTGLDPEESGGAAGRRASGARASAPRWPRCRSRCRWRCWCRRDCSRRACSTSAASTSASRPITCCCLRGARAERLRHPSARARCSSAIEDEFAALPGVTSVVLSMIPVLAGDNWGNSVVVEGFEAAPDTNTNASYNGVGPGLLPHDGHSADARARVHARRCRLARRRWRSSTRRSRASSTSGANAVGKRIGLRRRRTPARHRDHRRRAGREVQRGEARGAAAVLPAVPAARAPRLRLLLRADRDAAGAAARRRSRRDAQARSQPAGRRREDDGDADQGERLRRSDDQHAVAGVCRCWRRCWRRSVSTACWPTPWRSARASSACAWRSAPTAPPCAAWC